MISAFFTSGIQPGSLPTLPAPTDPVMRLLNAHPTAAYEAHWTDQPDTSGSIWHEQDPYTKDASYYGPINWG